MENFMKTFPFALVLVAASPLAMASELPNPIATYYKTSGSVAPQFKKVTDCKIFDQQVTKATYAPNEKVQPVVTKTAYTAEVPNAAAVKKLVKSAKKESIAKTINPIGGPRVQINGVLTVGAGAPENVVLLDLGSKRVGKAADKLIAFITYNCLEQN
jgi:hypothetical protein